MKFSGLIYPAPSPPSYNTDKLIGELLFIPKDFSEDQRKYIKKYATFSKSHKYRRGYSFPGTPNMSESKSSVLQEINGQKNVSNQIIVRLAFS